MSFEAYHSVPDNDQVSYVVRPIMGSHANPHFGTAIGGVYKTKFAADQRADLYKRSIKPVPFSERSPYYTDIIGVAVIEIRHSIVERLDIDTRPLEG